jgi:hypothetical protein
MKAWGTWPRFLFGMAVITAGAVLLSHATHETWWDSVQLAAEITPVPILSFALVRWDDKQKAAQEAAKLSRPPQ